MSNRRVLDLLRNYGGGEEQELGPPEVAISKKRRRYAPSVASLQDSDDEKHTSEHKRSRRESPPRQQYEPILASLSEIQIWLRSVVDDTQSSQQNLCFTVTDSATSTAPLYPYQIGLDELIESYEDSINENPEQYEFTLLTDEIINPRPLVLEGELRFKRLIADIPRVSDVIIPKMNGRGGLSAPQWAMLKTFIFANVNHIYDDDWLNCEQKFLKRHRLAEVQQKAVVIAPRRNGKTLVLIVFNTLMLLHVPKWISHIFSTKYETSNKIILQVSRAIIQLDGDDKRFAVRRKDELQVVPESWREFPMSKKKSCHLMTELHSTPNNVKGHTHTHTHTHITRDSPLFTAIPKEVKNKRYVILISLSFSLLLLKGIPNLFLKREMGCIHCCANDLEPIEMESEGKGFEENETAEENSEDEKAETDESSHRQHVIEESEITLDNFESIRSIPGMGYVLLLRVFHKKIVQTKIDTGFIKPHLTYSYIYKKQGKY